MASGTIRATSWDSSRRSSTSRCAVPISPTDSPTTCGRSTCSRRSPGNRYFDSVFESDLLSVFVPELDEVPDDELSDDPDDESEDLPSVLDVPPFPESDLDDGFA